MEKLKLTPNVLKIDDNDRTIMASITVDGQDLIPDDGVEYTLKLANASGHVKDITLTEFAFSSAELKSLPADTYTAEVWMTNGDKQRIYPSNGKAYLQIVSNVTSLVGDIVPPMTVDEISKKLDDIAKKGVTSTPGKSAYQTWLDLGHTGTEQDFLNSLKAGADKRPATSVRVDLSDTKNIIGRFDNGCWVELETAAKWVPLYATGAAGYGSVTSQSFVHDQCWCNVQSFINGFLTLDAIKKATPDKFEYWKTCVVHDPYADVKQYDWSACRITSTGSDLGEVDFVKMMFAVGLFSEQTILALGATKKS